MFVPTSQQLMPTGGTLQLFWQSESSSHFTMHAVLPLPVLLLLELVVPDDIPVPLDVELPVPGFPPSPPLPPVPGLLPKVESSPSAQARKLNPQSPMVSRRMLACFTALCFEATPMPESTQLPNLRFIADWNFFWVRKHAL